MHPILTALARAMANVLGDDRCHLRRLMSSQARGKPVHVTSSVGVALQAS